MLTSLVSFTGAVGPRSQLLSFKVYVMLNCTFARELDIVYIYPFGYIIEMFNLPKQANELFILI